MRRAVIALAILQMAMFHPAGAAGPALNHDFRVQVGAVAPDGAPFSFTRFFPENLRVHRGQSVLFDTVNPLDFYLVEFWPGGKETLPSIWRVNEDPERIALNDGWRRYGSSAGRPGPAVCGGEGEPPCRFDGSGVFLNSGLMTGTPLVHSTTWRVTFDVAPGTTVPYFCQIHAGMKGSVEVVDDNEVLPTQDQIDAQTREQVAADTLEATEYRAFRDAEAPRRSEDGRDVWQVRVGDVSPSGHVSIMAYMPSQLPDIQPGDAVEFESRGVGHHAVTFPTELVGPKAPGPESRLSSAAIHPTCDLDGDRVGGVPDVPGLWAPFTPAECPGTFELVLSPWLADPHPAPGNLVPTPVTYHDSGLMWSSEAPEYARARPDGSGSFPSKFVAEFPVAGSFHFACTVHGADHMAGTINVAVA